MRKDFEIDEGGSFGLSAEGRSSGALRAAVALVWGSDLGPQQPGEELLLADLLRPPVETLDVRSSTSKAVADEVVARGMTPTKDAEGDINVTSEGDAVGRGSMAPPVVRCAAVQVLASLARAERVKGRRCLCRIAEALADESDAVRAVAADSLEEALAEASWAVSILPLAHLNYSSFARSHFC